MEKHFIDQVCAALMMTRDYLIICRDPSLFNGQLVREMDTDELRQLKFAVQTQALHS